MVYNQTLTVLSLRKKCDTCDFDKSIDYSLDTPSNTSDVIRTIEALKSMFSNHDHVTEITKKIQVMEV